PAPAPAPEAKNNETLWVLQLASFGVRDNADALSKELESMGYNPLIEILKTDDKPIYRVRLQPVSDRDKLEETAKILNKKLKLSTQILQY
ncbi:MULTISPECIES: SPOR domain-containing protein, partial [unclassified Methylophaga]